MSVNPISVCSRAVLAAMMLLVAIVGSALPALPQASPFGLLAGSWRGSGTFSPLNEARERVVCRVTYTLSGGRLEQVLDCAGADYRIAATGNFTISGADLSGNWKETNFNLSGRAFGSTSADRIYVRIDSSEFQARMTIVVSNASTHTVDIQQFDPGTGRYSHMASITFRR